MGYELTEEEVKEFAPELGTGVLEVQWTEILSSVSEQVSTKQWGKEARARSGALNLAAHLATLRKQLNGNAAGAAAVPAGPLLSVTVGPISKTFANPSAASSGAASTGDTSLDTTSYGREYKRLRRLWSPRAAVA